MEDSVNTDVSDSLTVLHRKPMKPPDPSEYLPTPKESALLEVMLSPEHRGLSKTRQCEIAGVSRESYYKMFRRPAFMTYYRAALLDVVKLHAGEMVNVAIDQAKNGSFQHLRMLMEMGGFYKQEVEHNGEVNMIVRFIDPSADDPDITD